MILECRDCGLLVDAGKGEHRAHYYATGHDVFAPPSAAPEGGLA